MLHRVVLVLIHAAYLIPRGYSAFTGNLQVPIQMSGYDLLVDVNFGTPKDGTTPQKLIAVFDTGTASSWVVDKGNSFTEGLPTVPFDKEQSKTFTEVDSSYSTPIKSGKFEGSLGKDKVQIGTGDNAIVLDDLQFGLAKTIPPRYVGKMFDSHNALIGIGLFSKELGTTGNAEQFVEALRRKYNKVPNIGIYINVINQEKCKITFDGNDNGLYNGPLHSHDVVPNAAGKYDGWNVKLTKLAVIGKSGPTKQVILPEGTTAKLVTRMTPVILGPDRYITQLNQQIFDNVNFEYDRTKFKYDCGDTQKYTERLKLLPKVAIYFDDTEYILRPDEYIKELSGGTCMSGLVGTDVEDITFGEGFIENYYTRLDFENKKIHFAHVKL